MQVFHVMMEQIFIKVIGIVAKRNLGAILLQTMMGILTILHLLVFVCFSHGNKSRILYGMERKGEMEMGKISSQVSKGLETVIQEVKNKISDDTSSKELLNSGAEVQKKRHRRTKAEIQAEKEAKAVESQDNSLFEALYIHEESKKEEIEDNRPEWEKRSAKDNDEFCEWELEKAKLKGLENPDFDFRNFYEKGQTIYFIHILRGGINTKELKKLKIRTIYPRMMVCNEEKSCCQCIH